MKTTGLRMAWVGALALLLGGCVIAPYGYRHDRYSAEEGPVVGVAPPSPQYESAPAAPGPGHVWIGGYWGWNLGRHVWIGGRWALPPSGHAWVPGYWGRHQHGWRWRGGYWGRR
jgi:WXXGXW repeat (2 copies)